MIRNTILQGDALEVLKTLPDNCVQACVTSPPYYLLRDYGVPGQIGLEETPQEYIAKLVAVFREVKRILRSDGTLWLNIGDTYTGSGRGAGGKSAYLRPHMRPGNRKQVLPPKNLMLIPHRLAIALQDDGWNVRQDNVWSKSNGLPESVLDRPTRSHEYVFLLTKELTYFYNGDAIRKPLKTLTTFGTKYHPQGNDDLEKPRLDSDGEIAGSNARSVWEIASEPFAGGHFAVMPSKLAERCVLAGSSPYACTACGAPWKRVIERTPMQIRSGPKAGGYGSRTTDGISGTMIAPAERKTVGWEPGCVCRKREPAHVPGACQTKTDSTGWQPTRMFSSSWESGCDCAEQLPGKCLILDPFMGAGTTALVSIRHKREYLGIELDPDSIAIANKRIAVVQQTLW